MARKRNETDDEKLVEAGKSALRRQYYGFIRGSAQDILKEAQDQFDSYDEAAEWIYERVHETADGSHWVIYTYANLDTLVASDNWLAIDDVGIEKTESLTSVLTPAAYHAVVADLNESIDAYVNTGDYFADEDEENPRRNNPQSVDEHRATRAKLLR